MFILAETASLEEVALYIAVTLKMTLQLEINVLFLKELVLKRGLKLQLAQLYLLAD